MRRRFWGLWNQSDTWNGVRVGDFNGDGRDDLAGYKDSNGSWWVSLANSTGSRFERHRFWGLWKNDTVWHDVGVGDFNGDARADLIGRDDDGSWWVSLAHSTGDGSDKSSVWGQWRTHTAWHDVHVGDFNEDSLSDIIGRDDDGKWWASLSEGDAFKPAEGTSWT